MTLHEHRSRSDHLVEPIARWCAKRGIGPNTVSVVGLVVTLAAAVLLLVSTPDLWWLLPLGSAVLLAGTLLDMADGVLARMTDQATALGDYLDHSFDRFADVLLLAALAFSVWVPVEVGLVAIVGTLLTSYMGTQAQAVGVGRNYGGILGRADRMAILTIAPLVEAARVLVGYTLPWDVTVLTLALGWIGFAGLVTTVQRFAGALRELGRGGSRNG